MKKGVLLNSDISSVIANMGHTDMLVISDCGLPIPETAKKIDISLTKGTPGLIETMKAVLSELEVEEAIIAEETLEKSNEFFKELKEQLGNIPVKFVKHEEFKLITVSARACIRTGECIPYANIILKSGVTF